jgi:FMN phosphatase YigB (HAD superfamily)
LPKKPMPVLTGRTIRCILFDLGDTLWSRKDLDVWRRVETASNMRAASLLRTCVAPSVLPHFSASDEELGQRLHEAIEAYIREAIRQNPYLEPDCGQAVVHALHKWGIHLDRGSGEAIFEALRVRIPQSRPLFDDVLFTLKALQERGFQLGVVTNRLWGGKPFYEDLQAMGLLDYFDLRHIAISIDLGIRKPNPALFLHTLNALNTPPEEAAMVGDSLLSDITGSKKLGMFAIWKPKAHARTSAHRLLTSGTAKKGQLNAVPDVEVQPEHVPQGMHTTDDDYVLTRVYNREGTQLQEVQPDLIIGNLNELLDVFIKAGEQ